MVPVSESPTYPGSHLSRVYVLIWTFAYYLLLSYIYRSPTDRTLKVCIIIFQGGGGGGGASQEQMKQQQEALKKSVKFQFSLFNILEAKFSKFCLGTYCILCKIYKHVTTEF